MLGVSSNPNETLTYTLLPSWFPLSLNGMIKLGEIQLGRWGVSLIQISMGSQLMKRELESHKLDLNSGSVALKAL